MGFALTIVRSAQGWKRWELAEATGATRSGISSQEKGGRPLRREDLAAYAERMGFDVEDLDVVVSFAQRALARVADAGADDPEAADRRAIASAAERIVRSGSEAARLELHRAVKAERARKERAEAAALDLEASLRRAERRFDEALRLHDRALAVAPPASVAYVLLNKAGTFQQAGRVERAVRTLREAARGPAAAVPELRRRRPSVSRRSRNTDRSEGVSDEDP